MPLLRHDTRISKAVFQVLSNTMLILYKRQSALDPLPSNESSSVEFGSISEKSAMS